jgi:hypothetical protein
MPEDQSIARRERTMKERLPGFLFYAPAAMLSAPPVSAFQPPPGEFDNSMSEMRPAIERFAADRASLNRAYATVLSPSRQSLFNQFFTDWEARLATVKFESMSQDGKVDYILLRIGSTTISANWTWMLRRRAKLLPTRHLVRRF